MEEVQAQNPVADAADAPPPAPEESASPADTTSSDSAVMNALLRGVLPGSASNQDADDDDAEDVAAANGEPAQSRDAKPNSQQPGRRSRRAEEAAQRLSALEAENARLQSQLTELVPPPVDASEEARKAILASEDRFRRLSAKPVSDTDWQGDDWDWLESEKQRRALVPELRQHYETITEADRRVLRENAERERTEFWSRVGQDLATAEELPGVDIEALKKAPNFATRDRLVYAAAVATRDAENRALREENAQLKRDLFGSVRQPLNGGRSAGGAAMDENAYMNTLLRGGR